MDSFMGIVNKALERERQRAQAREQAGDQEADQTSVFSDPIMLEDIKMVPESELYVFKTRAPNEDIKIHIGVAAFEIDRRNQAALRQLTYVSGCLSALIGVCGAIGGVVLGHYL